MRSEGNEREQVVSEADISAISSNDHCYGKGGASEVEESSKQTDARGRFTKERAGKTEQECQRLELELGYRQRLRSRNDLFEATAVANKTPGVTAVTIVFDEHQ